MNGMQTVGVCKHVVTMVTAKIDRFANTGHHGHLALPCRLNLTDKVNRCAYGDLNRLKYTVPVVVP